MPVGRVETGPNLGPGEVDDVVEPLLDGVLGQPVQPGGEVDVVARRQLADEATGELDERGDATVDRDVALVGQQDTGDHLQRVLLPPPLPPTRPTASPRLI